MNSLELGNGLANFYGTEKWYRHPLLGAMLYTEGVQFFAENAGGGAYWFLDIVATEIFPLLKKQPFMVVSIDVEEEATTITANDGNGNQLFLKEINWTDCPEGAGEFYLTDNVLLLPSEY